MANDSQKWWVLEGGQATGPFSTAYLEVKLQSGILPGNVQICPVGGTAWKAICEWTQFAPSGSAARAPPPIGSSSVLELPGMANAICVYGMFVSPVLWFLGNISCLATGPIFRPESPLFLIEALIGLAGLFVGLVSTVLLFIGALRMRACRKTGANLAIGGIAVDLCWFSINCVLTLLLFAAAASDTEVVHVYQSESSEPTMACFTLLIGAGVLVFEVAAIAWLLLYKHLLPVKDSR